MDINLVIKAQFDTVYLINGKLFEGGQIEFGLAEVVYITVLPLEALLLPYTVMMVGSTIKSNKALASCYKLNENKYFLNLKPRHNYIYSVETQAEQPQTLPEKFFRLLKNKKVAAARELLTEELSASVDDSALTSFFNGFDDIIFDQTSATFYLISDSLTAHPYSFPQKNSLIDNILEL